MNDHSNVYSSEYPKQILNNIKHTKNGISTFAIEELFGYQDPLPENPMSLMNGYSVYSFVLIQNNKAVAANLRPTDLAALARKSELAFDMAFRHRYFQHFRAFHTVYQGKKSHLHRIVRLHSHIPFPGENTGEKHLEMYYWNMKIPCLN